MPTPFTDLLTNWTRRTARWPSWPFSEGWWAR